MPKDVRLQVSEEQHKWLTKLKGERGYTWKGLLLEGAKCLDTDGTQ